MAWGAIIISALAATWFAYQVWTAPVGEEIPNVGFVEVYDLEPWMIADDRMVRYFEAINHTSHNLPECGDIRCAQIINEGRI